MLIQNHTFAAPATAPLPASHAAALDSSLFSPPDERILLILVAEG